MITITLPIWLNWVITFGIAVYLFNCLLQIVIAALNWRIKKLKALLTGE